jgi:hypothetical protein
VTGPPNDVSREPGIEPAGPDPAVGEARWHMAGAVLAAMLLTLLLPSELRLGPRLLLPILEGALLVALIIGDPGRISKRSSVLRDHPDLAFPQQLNPHIAPANWRPRFIDTSTLGSPTPAFSPTDVMPLAPWAKLAMAVQAAISLAVLGLVVARAVNVLT